MKAELKELRSKVSSLLSSEEQLIGKLATSKTALEKVGPILQYKYFFYRQIKDNLRTDSQSTSFIFLDISRHNDYGNGLKNLINSTIYSFFCVCVHICYIIIASSIIIHTVSE